MRVSYLIHSGKHNRYDSSVSNDYRRDGRHFKITYGSGGVAGFTSIDTVTVSCVKIKFSIGQLSKAISDNDTFDSFLFFLFLCNEDWQFEH